MSHAPTLSVHDPDFKHLVTIPLKAVHHLPPAHLEISRLVLCRKYTARDKESCPMGDSCKFVHADLGDSEVITQSIHVNYAWRSLDDVTHERLPAGEMLQVMAPNNRAPSQLIPSEVILATKGAISRHESRGPLSHCAHYYFNRMCNRGDRCNFIHAVYIDPTAADFQRAPPRAGAGHASGSVPANNQHRQAPAAQQSSPAPSTEIAKSLPRTESDSSCGVSNTSSVSGRSSESGETTENVYRRNPYSLIHVTIPVM